MRKEIFIVYSCDLFVSVVSVNNTKEEAVKSIEHSLDLLKTQVYYNTTTKTIVGENSQILFDNNDNFLAGFVIKTKVVYS